MQPKLWAKCLKERNVIGHIFIGSFNRQQGWFWGLVGMLKGVIYT